jgi:phage gp36-like protein
MPYATPQRFIEQFGITEVTQLLMDDQRQLKPELLQAAMAGTLPAVSAGVTQAMLDAATKALARLVHKLATTSNFMDGYLRAMVQLPLSADDANAGTLEDCCLALTRFNLASDADNATERMDDLAAGWKKWLLDIAKGNVQLVRSDTGQGPATTHRVRTGQAATGFNWDFHQNFGNQGGQF